MPKKTKEEKEKKVKHARFFTPAERRDMFTKGQKEEDPNDYRIVRREVEEELVPYGFLVYDNVLRLRGLGRRGRVMQVHGNEGSAKSTSLYGIVRNYMKFTGEPAAIRDFERTCTTSYLESIGIDTNFCSLKQPDSVIDCIQDTIIQMQKGVRLFVFDSIPRMKTKVPVEQILKGDFAKASYGNHAKSMVLFYDTLLPYAAEYDCTFIMVNQTRDRIEDGPDARNAQKYPTFTNLPYTLPGGRICRFTPSVMIENKVQKAYHPGPVDSDDFILEPATPDTKDLWVATRIRVRTLKNKVGGGGYREGYIWIRPQTSKNAGVDENISIRELARAYGLIEFVKGKGWYVGTSYDEAITVYPTKDQAIKDLVIDENPKVLQALKPLVAEAIDADDSTRFVTEIKAAEKTYLEGVEDDPSEGEEATSKSFVVEEEIS